MQAPTTAVRHFPRAMTSKGAAALTVLALLTVASCSGGAPRSDAGSPGDTYTIREVTDGTTGFIVVTNPGTGPVLSYGVHSGVTVLTEEVAGKTFAFKDMNANGKLDAWEDWRKSHRDRAASLAADLSIEQLAGLMLFGAQEYSPADGITPAQKKYLSQSQVRNVNYAGPNDVEANVIWSNQMQSFAESLVNTGEPYIPVNFATDPRWLRTEGTFGENLELTSALAAANVAGFQSSTGATGWGPESINVMIKHWVGEGPGEGGREPHTNAGKYAVFPGENFDAHTQAFLGALDSASVMTSYSILLDGNGEPLFRDRTGAAYDLDRIALLREQYQGVIISDWNVTDSVFDPDSTGGTGWGVEDLTREERHYALLRTEHDMFGGNNDIAPVLAAFDLWQEDYEAGKHAIDAQTRFRQSAARILTMMFQPGLYENAYLDLERSRAITASPDKVQAGYQAQLASAVLLKNDAVTISPADAKLWKDKTVYIPRSYRTAKTADTSGNFSPEQYFEGPGIQVEVAQKYFARVVTDEAVLDDDNKVIGYQAPDLSDVDLVLVGMSSPDNGTHFGPVGHDAQSGQWYPLSLQYRPYTADGEHVRRVSISGDLLADGTRENRSYFGRTSRISNESDLEAFERAVTAVDASGKDIPVITLLKATNPTVPTEFEPQSDAIIVGFGISDQALVELALGLSEPRGRLPIGFPSSMDAVEAQLEDVGEDTEPYIDSLGNAYLFGFGLNFSGPIPN